MSNSFFAELKRRNVFKVAAGYLVLGWLVLQIADVVVPILELPDWTLKFLLFLGVIGFPFAVFFAWVYELTPDGIKLESEVQRDESITTQTGQTLNLTIIGLLVVALSYFIYQTYSTDNMLPAEPLSESGNANVESSESLEDIPGTSIAVLPFVNMSSDQEQEYFSDGISEEILNVLAQIPNLKVTSRSSAFSFKGKDIILSEVAQQLGVKHILEGSVRKAGNQLRITAQLIEAESDAHLWSETYDREINNIFQIQDEISQSIVEALKSKLNLNVDVVAMPAREIAFEAYDLYLQGRQLLEQRTEASVTKANEIFDEVISLEPTYADAWQSKARAIYFGSKASYGSNPMRSSIEQSLRAVDTALNLEPDNAEANAVKGLILTRKKEIGAVNFDDEARRYLERAIELNPNLSMAYSWYRNVLLDNSVENHLLFVTKAYELDPLSLLTNRAYAGMLILDEDYEQAEAVMEKMYLIAGESTLYYITKMQFFNQQARIGEAIYAQRQQFLLNPSFNNRFVYANDLAQLGLDEQAQALVIGDEYEAARHFYTLDFERLLKEVREKFPRDENDVMGTSLRAAAEMLNLNYQEAEYYIGDNMELLGKLDMILLHMGLGNEDKVIQLINDYESENLNSYFSTDNVINTTRFYSALFRQDYNSAINYLEIILKDNRLIPYYILHGRHPVTVELRNHPRWEELLEMSNLNKLKHQQVYLELVEQENNSST